MIDTPTTTPAPRVRSIDRATVPGLIIGIGALLVAFLIEGGGIMGLLNLPAAILVFGGTIGAGMVGFSAQ